MKYQGQKIKIIYILGGVYTLSLCPNCLESKAVYIGLQEGLKTKLNLFNCLGCKSTRTEAA